MLTRRNKLPLYVCHGINTPKRRKGTAGYASAALPCSTGKGSCFLSETAPFD